MLAIIEAAFYIGLAWLIVCILRELLRSLFSPPLSDNERNYDCTIFTCKHPFCPNHGLDQFTPRRQCPPDGPCRYRKDPRTGNPG